jgi:hypothetical protein
MVRQFRLMVSFRGNIRAPISIAAALALSGPSLA